MPLSLPLPLPALFGCGSSTVGYEVRILNNLQKLVHLKGEPAYLSSEFEFIEGDVRDRETLKKALLGVNVIYHFASEFEQKYAELLLT